MLWWRKNSQMRYSFLLEAYIYIYPEKSQQRNICSFKSWVLFHFLKNERCKSDVCREISRSRLKACHESHRCPRPRWQSNHQLWWQQTHGANHVMCRRSWQSRERVMETKTRPMDTVVPQKTKKLAVIVYINSNDFGEAISIQVYTVR